MGSIKLMRSIQLIFVATALLTALSACANAPFQDIDVASQGWKEDFTIATQRLTHTGETTYFILRPGFQTVLASEKTKLTITVLDEIKKINGIDTRVVEEREEKNGELYEVSRNFFAIDQETNDVFYFGEEVDYYDKGKLINHEGAWLAYENGNLPGLVMPGKPTVGMKYYQELAPGVSMDRAEVISISETFNTPAGELKNCLKTEESSKLKPDEKEFKMYAPGIGLVQDKSLKLVSYSYVTGNSSG